jgi:UDP-N-acetylglucosamine 4,6-dehydratase
LTIDGIESLRGRHVLVTGGSGTIGARLVERLLEAQTAVIRVFGRDETKQFYQRQRHRDRPDLRFLIGDIRDRDRLTRAMEGIDVVFHCAALKHVESGEYNPFEATQTNIVGTQNVIDACLANDVRTMVLTSSDKAANPTNVMGATKLLAEKLVTAATNYRGLHATTFASVRFGNVLGSRGSALELFASQVAVGGPVTMTDPTMTRFVMSTDRAVELCIEAAAVAHGGEVFVVKMPVARLDDLVAAAIEAFAPIYGRDAASIPVTRTAPRPGEKGYEELMTEDESTRAVDIGEMFAVLPSIETGRDMAEIYGHGSPAPIGPYRSDGAEIMDRATILDLLRETVAQELRP